MRKTLRQTMAAILLSSVALVPAATVSVIATADAAYAKSEKSRGGGGKPDHAGQKLIRGKSGDTTASRGGGSKSNRGLKGFGDDLRGMGREMRNLFDGDTRGKKPAKVAGGGKKAAAPDGEEQLFARGKSGKVSAFHPSELGNMNGAMNANINAVLAHIRNGNTNGPVGHMALLAVSGAAIYAAAGVVEREMLYQSLDDAVVGSEYDSLEDYLTAVKEGADRDPAIDAALDGVGYSEDGFAVTRPAEEDYLAAQEELDGYDEDDFQAKADAEAAILAYWNKNSAEGDLRTDEEQTLLDELYSRFDGQQDAIDGAIAASETHGSDEDDDDIADTCGDDEVCDEDDIALVD
ncbi:hypothetical protein GQ651_10450 [Alphaproteobacteria bacterium GH1-50]|uniref:Uncharacterized protein n=1 Tax=Kangsaoukella pontilimi TaxID=2691042 RepID=A0A7C9IQZ3_9RHOB|nr:hypothetical protein [Kangsaoukella pontilimi]MXQ08263.1 hypothetical protein [Kangsaoukella pontilimi]